MPFTIGPDDFENNEIRVTTNENGDPILESAETGRRLLVDEDVTLGELLGNISTIETDIGGLETDVGNLEDKTSGLSADGTEADLETVRTATSRSDYGQVVGRRLSNNESLTIHSEESMVVSDYYEVEDGSELEIENGGVLRVI